MHTYTVMVTDRQACLILLHLIKAKCAISDDIAGQQRASTSVTSALYIVYVCMYVCMYIHIYIHTYIYKRKRAILGGGGPPIQVQSCTVSFAPGAMHPAFVQMYRAKVTDTLVYMHAYNAYIRTKEY